jgi:hypothetical protein
MVLEAGKATAKGSAQSACGQGSLPSSDGSLKIIIIVLGIHCNIYKSAYNVSQPNSPLHHSPLSSLLHSSNNFTRSHFHFYS